MERAFFLCIRLAVAIFKAWGVAPLAAKGRQACIGFLVLLDSLEILVETLKNTLNLVKIILKKNGNFVLALRKRLFCDAKQPLLPCKTYAFRTQNNRFYNTLIESKLRNRYACEKYLHYFRSLPTYIIRCAGEATCRFEQNFCCACTAFTSASEQRNVPSSSRHR